MKELIFINNEFIHNKSLILYIDNSFIHLNMFSGKCFKLSDLLSIDEHPYLQPIKLTTSVFDKRKLTSILIKILDPKSSFNKSLGPKGRENFRIYLYYLSMECKEGKEYNLQIGEIKSNLTIKSKKN